jgi:hypothetical protein
MTSAWPRRHSCAPSRSYQSHSLLYPSPLSERALTVRGARITAAWVEPTAAFIRLSNVRPHVQETVDLAHEIHSQRMAPQQNREGAIGETISNTDGQCHAYWNRPGPKQLLDLLINLFYRTALCKDKAWLRCRAFCCYQFSLFQIGDDMARKNSKRREWTKTDVRELKALAREKTPARKIARTLKRTEGATRQKAFSLGVSLDSRA